MIDVCAGICMRDGRFFMSQRDIEEKSYPGCWCFPGGKIEPGESPRGALIREFAEEVGLQITPAYAPYAVFDIGNYRFHCFTTSIESPKSSQCLDATIGFGWFTPVEIRSLNTTSLTHEALRRLP